ncbi:MAG: 2-oxo-4-hydroxy-4-carboxy-5-ureidoimidazoline decarboxylase [Gemmatimonadota bacterium]|nr:2-oxo-4-hydroxy-4-carboxy-5-ureidoimidazoline decarboxylase [Gemmatimonadota bacterium]
MSGAPGVAAFDAMSVAEAEAVLLGCGGARGWVRGMLARRPFGTAARARAAADECWATLGPDDWREAMARHPRIGERGDARSAREQSGVAVASAEVRAALAEANRAYEARFGHIYLVCAAGKSAQELLDTARARLANDPVRELAVAGEELRRIMQLRLAQVMTHDDGAGA